MKKASRTLKTSSAAASLITLSTDFGTRDPFAGQMKGVILSVNPRAVITDLTHGIPRHDVREAARVIGESHRYFPEGTVHVVVVDPGVGSARRPIIIRAGGHFFVGPDNGVFTLVIRDHPNFEAIHITAENCFLKSPAGGTFHGRDVFAPVAAWLSKGHKPEKFGNPAQDIATIDIPSPLVKDDMVSGEVSHIDAFGNCISNIRAEDMEGIRKGGKLHVRIKGQALDILRHYSEAADDRPRAVINSDGYVEIFICRGSAARALGVSGGEKVEVLGATGQETI